MSRRRVTFELTARPGVVRQTVVGRAGMGYVHNNARAGVIRVIRIERA